MEQIISILLVVFSIYIILGVLFSFMFLWKGLHLVDPNTQGANRWFKVLIFPGLVVFWIVFLFKWINTKK